MRLAKQPAMVENAKRGTGLCKSTLSPCAMAPNCDGSVGVFDANRRAGSSQAGPQLAHRKEMAHV